MQSLLVFVVSGTLTVAPAAQSTVAPASAPLRTVPAPPIPVLVDGIERPIAG